VLCWCWCRRQVRNGQSRPRSQRQPMRLESWISSATTPHLVTSRCWRTAEYCQRVFSSNVDGNVRVFDGCAARNDGAGGSRSSSVVDAAFHYRAARLRGRIKCGDIRLSRTIWPNLQLDVHSVGPSDNVYVNEPLQHVALWKTPAPHMRTEANQHKYATLYETGG